MGDASSTQNTALAELHAGRPGPATLGLLRRVIRAVASRHNYPHPDPDKSWGDDGAYDAAISAFFAEKDGQRRLDTIAVDATNDCQLRDILISVVRNWFRDLARATPRGRLHRATKRTLREEPEVFAAIAPTDFWTLCDDPQEPGVISDAVLDAALGQVDIVVIRARPDGVNERPWASREHQVAALEAMLQAAACATHLKDLVRAIAARIGLLHRPTRLDIDEAGADLPTTISIDDEGSADRARAIYAELSDRERLVLAYGEEKVRDIAAATGIPPSSVQDIRKRVAAALDRTGAVDDHAVLAELRAMCGQFDAARTRLAVLPSGPSERDDSGH